MNEQEEAKLKELIGNNKGMHWWDGAPGLLLILSWVIGWIGTPTFLVLYENASGVLEMIIPTCVIAAVSFHIYISYWYLGTKSQSRALTLLSLAPFGAWRMLFLEDRTFADMSDK